ncbi:MAG: hypothetical protein KGO49_06165 [Gammaproteobacteria bacterium]|nr:hypothetical protein [Gammaproteobacteria bacterium]
MMQIIDNLPIPTDEDWGDYSSNLDLLYIYNKFNGKSYLQVYENFKRSPTECCFELYYMPIKPFQYYTLALSTYILSELFTDVYKFDLVNCFLWQIQRILNDKPEYITPIWNTIETTSNKIMNNKFFADYDDQTHGEQCDQISKNRLAYKEHHKF